MSSLSVQAALVCLLARRKGTSHPKGEWNGWGWWVPSKEERQVCCKDVVPPTQKRPLSWDRHCRTIKHVANLFGVHRRDLSLALRDWLADQKAMKKGIYQL